MTAPAWKELKADGRVIWDALPAYGLAVYAGEGGAVVLLTIEDGKRTYTTLCVREFPAFLAATHRAMQEAKEVDLEMDVAYETHLLIERARESR